MCQWLPLPNLDAKICFACQLFQSSMGEANLWPPRPILRIGDRWWAKSLGQYLPPNAQTHGGKLWKDHRVPMINVHEKLITDLYYWWLGQKMLEDLSGEEHLP